MTSRLRAATAAVCVVAVIGGCASTVSAPPEQNRPSATIEPPFEGAAVLPPPNMTDDGPGSLLEVTPLKNAHVFDQVNAVGVRVVYRSTDSTGKPTAVSGVVVVPPGKPPRGGWPVVSYGHQLTGVQNECALSLVDELGGYSGALAVLVSRGYMVAMTDYQGLGLPDFKHPLLDSATLGNNMIDAVRAARRVLPAAGNRWVAYGSEQGGMAAWGAAEQAPTYGNGLDLVGAVAISPLANLTGLADAAENGTLDPQQYRLYIVVLDSLAASPDYRLNLDDYRSGAAAANWDTVTDCALGGAPEGKRAIAEIRPGDLRPSTPSAAQQLRDVLQGVALPGPAQPSAPLFVAYATLDQIIPPAGVEQAVRTACQRGQAVEVMRRIGKSSTLDNEVTELAVAWVHSRFAGQRVANVCVGM